ncbi:Hypothetical_protein [Hexamita inflata]|uniref:Hypothetical_protein n=1 Tax=Hexamita inflata TaxID=28002 RepID=A0AA86R6T6_9EUKA|nr:Hypothetical protein HINF_LOCUS54757 [Hexamita inflata]
MPYVFKECEESLEVTYNERINKQSDEQQLSCQYYTDITFVDITFDNCQIAKEVISKTRNLYFHNCSVNLAQLQGKWITLKFYKCICVNDFQPLCDISNLIVECSQFRIKQLNSIQLVNLNIYYNQQNNIDFSQKSKINCSNKSLSLTELTIDLNQFSGQWEKLYICNCAYIGELQINSLNVSSIKIETEDTNHLDMFNNINCETLAIHALSNIQNNIFLFENLFADCNKERKRDLQITLNNYKCNLNHISGNWSNITFYNCYLFQNQSMKLDTQIKVTINQQSKFDFDFKALQGIQNLIVEIEDHDMDFSDLVCCKPSNVVLKNLKIDLQQLYGTWNQLIFSNCKFKNANISQQIIAAQIKFIEPDLSDFRSFQSDKVQIINANVNSLSDSKSVSLDSCAIYLQQNSSAQYLILSKCKLFRFSLIKFPQIINVQCQLDKKQTIGSVFKKYLERKKKLDKDKTYFGELIILENSIQRKLFSKQKKISTLLKIIVGLLPVNCLE